MTSGAYTLGEATVLTALRLTMVFGIWLFGTAVWSTGTAASLRRAGAGVACCLAGAGMLGFADPSHVRPQTTAWVLLLLVAGLVFLARVLRLWRVARTAPAPEGRWGLMIRLTSDEGAEKHP